MTYHLRVLLMQKDREKKTYNFTGTNH